MTPAEFGAFIGWGTGPQGAASAIRELSFDRVLEKGQGGLTAADAAYWRDFYQYEYGRTGGKNQTALLRSQLMDIYQGVLEGMEGY